MTQRLKVRHIVRATTATRYDVIDIGRGYYPVGVDGKGIDAQGVGTEEHGPLLSPACTIAAL